jgi:hypothetical protein
VPGSALEEGGEAVGALGLRLGVGWGLVGQEEEVVTGCDVARPLAVGLWFGCRQGGGRVG